MIDIAFNELNIKTLNAITIKENIASQKLIEKLDFNYIKMIEIPNDDEELMLYELENY